MEETIKKDCDKSSKAIWNPHGKCLGCTTFTEKSTYSDMNCLLFRKEKIQELKEKNIKLKSDKEKKKENRGRPPKKVTGTDC